MKSIFLHKDFQQHCLRSSESENDPDVPQLVNGQNSITNPYNGTLADKRKERCSDTCHRKDELQKHYAQ